MHDKWGKQGQHFRVRLEGVRGTKGNNLDKCWGWGG